jgi:hypothetical protein
VNRIVLTTYEWLYGMSTVAVVFLSIAAGIIAISLFKASFKYDELKAWRFMIWALIFFCIGEIFGALKVFGIYTTPHITHVIPSFTLGALIIALVRQIYINKGCA